MRQNLVKMEIEKGIMEYLEKINWDLEVKIFQLERKLENIFTIEEKYKALKMEYAITTDEDMAYTIENMLQKIEHEYPNVFPVKYSVYFDVAAGNGYVFPWRCLDDSIYGHGHYKHVQEFENEEDAEDLLVELQVEAVLA